MALRMRRTAPKVLVLRRMWATLRRYSNVVSFFWSGKRMGSQSPRTSISEAWISTAWPLPCDSTSCPFTAREAPVVMRLRSSSSNSSVLATIWILLMVEPSFRAMNFTCLLPRLVRTQPLASTSRPGSEASRALILVLFTVSIISDTSNHANITFSPHLSKKKAPCFYREPEMR